MKTCATSLKTFKKDEDFQRFLSSCQNELASRDSCVRGSMTSFLIMPVQRIPRYSLLVQELLRCLPNNHRDAVALKEALDEIHDATERIDNTIAERQAKNQLLELESRFRSSINLTAPGRRLIHEGILTRITRRGNSKR